MIKSDWDFILYKKDNYYVLKVVFSSSMADFTRSFKFELNEIDTEIEDLKELSKNIRNNYELYKNIEILLPPLNL